MRQPIAKIRVNQVAAAPSSSQSRLASRRSSIGSFDQFLTTLPFLSRGFTTIQWLFLLITTLVLGWVVFLVLVQLWPTQVANALMGTGDLEGGDFWLLESIDASIVYFTVTVLALAAAVHVVLLVLIARIGCTRTATAMPSRGQSAIGSAAVGAGTAWAFQRTIHETDGVETTAATLDVVGPVQLRTLVAAGGRWARVSRLYPEMTFEGKYRQPVVRDPFHSNHNHHGTPYANMGGYCRCS